MIVVAGGLVVFAVAFSDRLGPVTPVVLLIAIVNAVRGGLWFFRRRPYP
jgi:hypothetical protein